MKVQNDVRVTFRVDRELKESAERLFDYLGMNMSTALNVFLRKSVDEKAIPFEIGTKAHVFGVGISPDEITDAFTNAVDAKIIESKKKGYPVAKYDIENKRAYLEVAEGLREYVN